MMSSVHEARIGRFFEDFEVGDGENYFPQPKDGPLAVPSASPEQSRS
jgi:hypothetical protein